MLELGILSLLLNKNENGAHSGSIVARALTVAELFAVDNDFSIVIPEYQRPYVWDKRKVEVLIEDLEDYFRFESAKIEEPSGKFYMGSLLLHEKDGNVLSIIDGQQRITTLLMLDHFANKEKSILATHGPNLGLTYTSPRSKENILQNKEYITNEIGARLMDDDYKNLLKKIVVTVIITKSEDDAFTFFDTQNTRGVSLSAIDFLKSYHLRELKGEDSIQREFAAKWDKSNQNQFLEFLFDQILWRARNWRGRIFSYENKDLVLDEFQKRSIARDKSNTVLLYPNNRNRLGTSFSFSPTDGMNINAVSAVRPTGPLAYPFSLRQPVQKGVGFFLFTERYTALYNYIFTGRKTNEPEIDALIDFYKHVYMKVSDYLKGLFELCIVMYYDKFEGTELLAFGLWIDHLIGSYRVFQRNIVTQTPIKILRDKESNLLDIIEGAYRPQEIFSFIQNITIEEWYREETIDDGNGVQARYKRQIKVYYDKQSEKSLANKKKWLNDKIKSRYR